MMTSSNRAKLTKGVAALAATASLGSLILSAPTPAGADSQKLLVGVGSDTTQDVMNALAGNNNDVQYPPVQSSKTSGRTQVASFDATQGGVKGTCITPSPGATFARPNGSTNGRKAFSRAILGEKWNVVNSTCPGFDATPPGAPTAGKIQFARSSAGPSGPGTDLTYMALGRDGLSFAAYRASGTPVTALPTSTLSTIFTSATGQASVGGVNYVGCSIQLGSGTYAAWNTALGVTAAQMAAATSVCTPGSQTPSTEIQENDGTAFKARADLTLAGATPPAADSVFVIGFSAANFISQSNGVAASQLPPGDVVKLGSIDGLAPYTGTAPALSPNPAFYATVYGRTVYNVLNRTVLTGPGNNDIKTLFGVTAPSADNDRSICSAAAQATIGKFGFAPTTTPCGDTSLTGPFVNTDGAL